MNFEKEIERCMQIEDANKMRSEIKRFEDYFNSEEYRKNLSAEQLEVIEKSKKYKELFDVDLERTQFGVMSGYACGPCANLIGTSEIRIKKDGEVYYVSANFIDEVSDVLAFIVNKEKSTWAVSFKEQLLPEEEKLTEDEIEELVEYETLYVASDDEWLESEYAALFLAATNKLAEEFLVFEQDKIDAETLAIRYFYSRLWFDKVAKENEFSEIYDIISCY